MYQQNNKNYFNVVSKGMNNNAVNSAQRFSTNNAVQQSNGAAVNNQVQPTNNYSYNTNQYTRRTSAPATIVRPETATNNPRLNDVQLGPMKITNEKQVVAPVNTFNMQIRGKEPPAQNTTQANGAKKAEKRSDWQRINEQIHIFTGTAEKIIKWNKIKKDYFCYYEVLASVIAIQPGALPLQQVMLLRDRKGPIIQVVRYDKDHINIEDFYVGQVLRCVGRMVNTNTIHAVSIRAATDTEIATLQRISHICDDAVTKSIRKEN